DPDPAAASLRKLLGSDIRVFTRPELEAHETSYWTTRTSVGLLFGSGLIISFIVGVMVVYQILATQVSRQLPQFATLKAVGYGDGFLAGTVVTMALLIVLAGFFPALLIFLACFFPALAAAWGFYTLTREDPLLQAEMPQPGLAVFLGPPPPRAAASALLSMSSPRPADPADLFG